MSEKIEKIPNGGFPKIKYCKNTISNILSNERSYASNITEIFDKNKIKKLVINLDEPKNTINVNEFNEL